MLHPLVHAKNANPAKGVAFGLQIGPGMAGERGAYHAASRGFSAPRYQYRKDTFTCD